MVNAGTETSTSPRAQRPASSAFSAEHLAVALARLPPARRLRVAFSGGGDSLALLHALGELRERLAPTAIDAVHVHHGLHELADAWVDDCRRMCARIEVPLEVLWVDATPECGESPEAAARRARYQALTATLQPQEVVCTAHHQRDQAETLLLQLVRGAGPAGLAGMPALATLGKGWLARPLLDWSPADLRAYLEGRGIAWTEDPSNADARFDRNFLRHEILPRIAKRWPGVERTLARAAAHQADSAAVGEALAGIDLVQARGPYAGTLSASALKRLPAARARNLLRGWLAACGLPMPHAAHVEQILAALVMARDDATPLVSWPGAEVRRHRDALHASTPLPAHDPARIIGWDPRQALALPDGVLEALAVEGRGLSVERCRRARLEVRFRHGGERFRPAGRRQSTALKKLLQSSAVPPWLRDRIPLIYVNDELAAVAGLWVGEGFAVADRSAGWELRWTALRELLR